MNSGVAKFRIPYFVCHMSHLGLKFCPDAFPTHSLSLAFLIPCMEDVEKGLASGYSDCMMVHDGNQRSKCGSVGAGLAKDEQTR